MHVGRAAPIIPALGKLQSCPNSRWGGSLSGLAPGTSLSLSNGVETLTINSNGPFAFAPVSGFIASISVKKHPGSGVQCALLDASNPDAIGGNYVLSDKSAQAIQVTCEIYPAFKAPLPVIQATPFYKDQLVVIPNPRIVPVFYQDSPAQAARVDFLRKLIASPLWLGLLEYGVGAATLEPAVVTQAKAPQLLTTSQAIDLFRRNASSWVNPNDPKIFFILYLPDTTQIDGMACGGGYHHTSNYPNIGNVAGPKIAFAVVSGCGRPDQTAEHEIMEGAADPTAWDSSI